MYIVRGNKGFLCVFPYPAMEVASCVTITERAVLSGVALREERQCQSPRGLPLWEQGALNTLEKQQPRYFLQEKPVT